jgi:hypothetical protein
MSHPLDQDRVTEALQWVRSLTDNFLTTNEQLMRGAYHQRLLREGDIGATYDQARYEKQTAKWQRVRETVTALASEAGASRHPDGDE